MFEIEFSIYISYKYIFLKKKTAQKISKVLIQNFLFIISVADTSSKVKETVVDKFETGYIFSIEDVKKKEKS